MPPVETLLVPTSVTVFAAAVLNRTLAVVAALASAKLEVTSV
jgi:hypothetical protein